MPRIDTGREHQLAYRQRFSLGCRLFGCALLLAGAVMGASPLLAAGAEPSQAGRTIAVVGVLLAALGLAIVFASRGKLFDREEGTITFWYGVGRRWQETVYDLRSFTTLVVRPDFEREGSWELSLESPSGESLHLFRLPNESAVRIAATEIAGFLNVPIFLAPAAAPPETAAADPASEEAASLPDAGSPPLPVASAPLPPAGQPPIERTVAP